MLRNDVFRQQVWNSNVMQVLMQLNGSDDFHSFLRFRWFVLGLSFVSSFSSLMPEAILLSLFSRAPFSHSVCIMSSMHVTIITDTIMFVYMYHVAR